MKKPKQKDVQPYTYICEMQKYIDYLEAKATRDKKMETIVRLFSKIMYYCDWKWETPNERIIEMLMKEAGFYPFKDEDDMISKTFVNEKLYKDAIKAIPTRFVKSNNIEKKTECSK